MSKDTIPPKAIECRFAVHCNLKNNSQDDLHFVKEIIHYENGETKPNFRKIKNFKRPIYVTKQGFRNHKQSKEWEDIDKLNLYETTQSNLLKSIAKALGTPWLTGSLKQLSRSPYLYGTDILSTAIIKEMYSKKYPINPTKYTMAAFDVETDVAKGTNEIIISTISFGSKVFTAVRKDFLAGYADPINRLQKALTKYIGDHVENRKIDWELVILDNEVDLVQETFKRAHAWMPDFVAAWNMDFDITKSLDALAKAGVDPKYVFSDPSIPDKFKFFDYKRGPSQKVTASGKATPLKPHERWNTVYCPSSFYFIDPMCSYKKIRVAAQEEQSYGLDAILNKHELPTKLKFKEADGLSKTDWHIFMQENYPIEYVIYNVFDCIAMELLDEKTLDLSLSLPMMSGCSDFANFKSQPRRLVDALHWTCLENKKVIGTTSDQMADEIDKETLGLQDWIEKNNGPLIE